MARTYVAKQQTTSGGTIGGYYADEAPAATNPAPPPAAPAPINRTIIDGNQYNPDMNSGGVSAADQYLDTFRAPESREQIVERRRRESQGLIDSIEGKYNDMIEQRTKGVYQERYNLDNALSVITGNAGGSEAIGSRKKVTDANQAETDAINRQRALELAQVYTNINSAADEEARAQLEDAARSAEQVVARRQQAQAQAIESLKLMASGGLIDFDAFKSSPQNAKVFKYALDSVGGSEQALQALFMMNRPQDQLVGEPMRIGQKFVQAYRNPTTGKVKYEQLELPFDLPMEYNSFQKMGNSLVAIPDNWDGDPTKLKTVYTESPGAAKRDTQVIEVDGRKVLIDTQTGEEIKSMGGGTSSQGKANAQQAYDAVTSLLQAKGKSSAVGVKGLGNYLPGTSAQSFKADLERTKALLTLPALQQMKGLGAMSDREFATLTSSAAALNTNMSEADFSKELRRIQSALQSTINGVSQSVITAPDGTEVQIID